MLLPVGLKYIKITNELLRSFLTQFRLDHSTNSSCDTNQTQFALDFCTRAHEGGMPPSILQKYEAIQSYY